MSKLSKTLIVSSAFILLSANPVIAQTAIPTPQSGMTESDFAKDVNEGQQSIKGDFRALNFQKEINLNELDEGLQGDIETEKIDELKLDDILELDEAQELETSEPKETEKPEASETPEANKTNEPAETPSGE